MSLKGSLLLSAAQLRRSDRDVLTEIVGFALRLGMEQERRIIAQELEQSLKILDGGRHLIEAALRK